MTKASVLIVDDHIAMAGLVAESFGDLGWACRFVGSGRAAIDALQLELPDLLITDLRMADVDGFDVLDAARTADPTLPVIIMTAFGGVDSAVEAMRRGAWTYIVKPVRLDELALQASRAIEQRALRRENVRLRAENRQELDAILGRGRTMRELYELIERVAPSPAPVLIRGESGTGKELVARAIHARGPRHAGPFVAINCTALPESLLESELFGHARGAFTGAHVAREGLFVEASGGTLFLDEVGDMPAALQAKLLRVVQQGEIRPVGADESRKVDVRLVAATHQDLETRVAEGRFRADLYYRLDVVRIEVPPLRDRVEDIPILVDHFLRHAQQRNPHSPVRRIAPEVIASLARRSWPGNVRELENLIERIVVTSGAVEVTVADLGKLVTTVGEGPRFSFSRDRISTLHELEDDYIAWVVEQCAGNKTRAAEMLGVDPSTLHRRIRSRPR